MKALTMCAAALAVLAAPVAAETRYDRKLEQAVLTIVARKMGDIRGGFSYDAKPELVVVQDRITTGSTGIETERIATLATEPEGLVPAVDRTISRIITF
jgi:hypothetical protein